jgi:hypothetical protein
MKQPVTDQLSGYTSLPSTQWLSGIGPNLWLKGLTQHFALLIIMMASVIPLTEGLTIEDRACSRSPWIPAIGESWQIVLNAPLKIDQKKPQIAPDVNVYTIDLFDNSAQTVAALHKLNKKVIAYFSAGTFEEWRSDAKKFSKADLGKPLEDWAGERWLSLKSKNVRQIMANRIKLAAEKGFDAIDPDNVDGYVKLPRYEDEDSIANRISRTIKMVSA